jgi:hypothetical protein
MGDVGAGRTPQLGVTKLQTVPDAVSSAIRNAAAAPPALRAAVGDAARAPEARQPTPGIERWPVKTGTDKDVDEVGRNASAGAGADGIVDTTVEELIDLPRPAGMTDIHGMQAEFQEHRAALVETTIWRVTADIIAIKKEADGDFQMVLQGDSGDTMIAEAPTPHSSFLGDSSPWLDAMKEVRRRIANQFGPGMALRPQNAKNLMPAIAGARAVAGLPAAPPPTAAGAAPDFFEAAPPFKSKVDRTHAVIIGAGFFDRMQDQMGVALKNGIELHPVLSIEFL